MGGVGGTEGTRKVLRTQHFQAAVHWKELRLSMEMFLRGPLVATSSDPHICVLDALEMEA